MSLPNVWHHRRVAEGSAKACWICYKPSTSVLITPDNKDFFYICVGHLKDRGFCQADADEVAAATAKKRQEDLDREIEKVKQEYEEKQKRKKEKRKQKEKDKDKDEDSKKQDADSKKQDGNSKKKDEDEDKQDEKDKDDKIKALSKSKDEQASDEGPRIFSLQKSFYQMRLDRIRNAEIAKRNRERLKNPANFPSVPSGDL